MSARLFRHILLAMLAALLLLITGVMRGSAQDATAPIDHLEVALWPEFDQPAMLVIYRFELTPDTPLPTRVALPVPVAAGAPHAIAWLGADNMLYDADFTAESVGDWMIVVVEMPASRSGQLEYYSDMDFAGTIRSFLFDWPQGFELGGMSYKVQQPVAASKLRVVPAPDGESPGEFGLTYLAAEMGPQPADSAPAISVTYEKSNPALSVEALQPLGQVTNPVTQSGDSNFLPWLFAALGLIILGGGVYYLVFRRRPVPQRVPRRRRKRTTDVELEASTVYCHNCGAAAGISDVYCRQCGTQLRR